MYISTSFYIERITKINPKHSLVLLEIKTIYVT